MRSFSAFVLVISLGLALAVPTKRLEKKSTSEYQRSIDLDKTKSITDEDLLRTVGGEHIDRAKKSTTFCVEIRNDQPVPINCDDAHKTAPLQPTPVHQVPMSIDPEPAPMPAPAPAPMPVPVPAQAAVVIPEPCEPEIGAFLVRGQEQIIYAPTGNCMPKAPTSTLLHVPVAPPAASQPAHASLHLHPKPLHQHLLHHYTAPAVHTPLVKPIVKPVHQHLSTNPDCGHQMINGIECTCKSNPALVGTGRSADSSPTNEALAMKFLEELQKNVESQARFVPLNRPSPGVQSQIAYQQHSNMPAPYPMGSLPLTPLQPGYNHNLFPLVRSELDSSFPSGQIMQGVRMSRGPDDSEAPKAAETTVVKPEEVKVPTPTEMMDKMKKTDETNARIARFLADKEEDSNKLDDA